MHLNDLKIKKSGSDIISRWHGTFIDQWLCQLGVSLLSGRIKFPRGFRNFVQSEVHTGTLYDYDQDVHGHEHIAP